MKKQFIAVTVTLASTLTTTVAAHSARAEEAPLATTANAVAGPTSQQIVSTPVKPGSPWDSFSLTYFATYHGAPLNDLGSSWTTDNKGNKSKFSGINLDSEIAPSYLFTPTIGLGAVIPFLIMPVRGEGFILGDLGARVFNRKLINRSNFWLSANFIVQFPTSKRSRDLDQKFALKVTPAARYRFGSSRWSLGAWTEAKTYLGVKSDKTLKLWAMPYVNYNLTPSVSLNVGYELEAHHDVGMQGADLRMYQSDIQPGVVWLITPHVMVNPFLQIFTTTSDIGTDHMALGAVFSATVL